jgi:acetyl-CoA carboxylase carboxyltransferase component
LGRKARAVGVDRALVPSTPTAIRRIEALADLGTVALLTQPPGPVAMRAAEIRVNGRPVIAYAHDPSIAGGSLAAKEAAVLLEAMRLAQRRGCPVIGAVSCPGARIQAGADALDAYGAVLAANVSLRGRVPQVSIVLDACAGGGCYSPALTDFVIASKSTRMFLTGPAIVRQTIGEDVDAEALGGAAVHARNGVAHLVAEDEDGALALGRRLVGYLPGAGVRFATSMPAGDEDPAQALPENPRQTYDIRRVITAIADRESMLELAPRWAPNIVVALTTIDGQPVGVVANQPKHLGGAIDTDASSKAAWFVSACDRIGIPLLVLVDTPGFMPGSRQESAGIIRIGSHLVRAFAEATVPRVTVVVRKAFGGGYIAMNSPGLGADAWLAWPNAQVGVVGAEQAVGVLHRKALDAADDPQGTKAQLVKRYAAALSDRPADRLVTPRDTRTVVIRAIRSATEAGASRQVPLFGVRPR